MRILVTGSSGQLGSELRYLAQGSAHSWLFCDVAELDITQPKAVENFFEQHRPEVVVNCAAYTAVDKAEEDEEACMRINAEAVGILAHTCLRYSATLIHISTDYVFSGTAHKPLLPTDATEPIGVYGRSKLRGEELIRQSGCRHIILRTSWLYSSHGGNFVKTMLKFFGERELVKVVSDQVGTPTYARDLAEAILHIIYTDQLGKTGTYHYSNLGVCSWYDFAHAIATLSGSTCRVEPCKSAEFPTKAKRPLYSVLDTSSTTATFGLGNRHWQDALADCLQAMGASAQR